jgi:hypothetical protein
MTKMNVQMEAIIATQTPLAQTTKDHSLALATSGFLAMVQAEIVQMTTSARMLMVQIPIFVRQRWICGQEVTFVRTMRVRTLVCTLATPDTTRLPTRICAMISMNVRTIRLVPTRKIAPTQSDHSTVIAKLATVWQPIWQSVPISTNVTQTMVVVTRMLTVRTRTVPSRAPAKMDILVTERLVPMSTSVILLHPRMAVRRSEHAQTHLAAILVHVQPVTPWRPMARLVQTMMNVTILPPLTIVPLQQPAQTMLAHSLVHVQPVILQTQTANHVITLTSAQVELIPVQLMDRARIMLVLTIVPVTMGTMETVSFVPTLMNAWKISTTALIPPLAKIMLAHSLAHVRTHTH